MTLNKIHVWKNKINKDLPTKEIKDGKDLT